MRVRERYGIGRSISVEEMIEKQVARCIWRRYGQREGY